MDLSAIASLCLALLLGACAYVPVEGDDDVEVRTLARHGRVALRGTVVHRHSEQPIAGARVTVDHGGRRPITLTTDADGEFHVRRLPPGEHAVFARHGRDCVARGYRARPGQRFRVTLRLLPTRETVNACDDITLQ